MTLINKWMNVSESNVSKTPPVYVLSACLFSGTYNIVAKCCQPAFKPLRLGTPGFCFLGN